MITAVEEQIPALETAWSQASGRQVEIENRTVTQRQAWAHRQRLFDVVS